MKSRFCLLFFLFPFFLLGQVAISEGGGDPDASSILELDSESKGMLVPRMTTGKRNQIVSPAEGLLIFNTTQKRFNYYSGEVWYTIGRTNLCSPVIATEPQNVSDCPGANISFHVSANGDGLTYTWQEDQGAGYADLFNGGLYSGTHSTNLQISGLLLEMDGYNYRCIVSGACPPNDTTTEVSLEVYAPLQITSQPQMNQPYYCNANLAQITIGCSGFALDFQWQENDGTGYTDIVSDGYQLQFFVLSSMDGYQYRCIVTDACGNSETSDGVTLIVGVDNDILGQPQDQTVFPGNTANFTVTAGYPSESAYFWQENDGGGWTSVGNGGDYSGADTATLTISNVSLGMDGYQYRCRVLSQCDDLISAPATLTVSF